MEFDLTQEQQQLRHTVREFSEREIRPHVMEWDEAAQFPLETIKELGKLGLLGMIFPAEYGGAEMGYIEYATAIEELSRVDGSVGIIVAAHTSLCSNHIFLAGSQAQRRCYLPKLATGEHIGAWGLTKFSLMTRVSLKHTGRSLVVPGGMTLAFLNYADELPYFAQEVLPRLEKMGIRLPR